MITSLQGAGLGLRRALLPELLSMDAGAVDFLECAPDNWIGVGGSYGNALATLAERYPLSCHGLSLSLGGPMPLDHAFLRRTREFLDRHTVALFSEHSRLSPLAHALLESLQQRQLTGREHLSALAAQAGIDLNAIEPQGTALLYSLKAQGVVLGTQPEVTSLAISEGKTPSRWAL
ncbi:hypothetical protein D3C77_359970 [compost metagenome]